MTSGSGMGVPEADAFSPGCEGADVRVVRRVALVMGGHTITPQTNTNRLQLAAY